MKNQKESSVRHHKIHHEKVYIYGTHALVEALTNAPHVVRKVFLSQHAHSKELGALLKKHEIPVAPLSNERGTELTGRDAVHQGVIATINPSSLLVPFETFIEKLDLTKKPALVVLGEVQDPHNVGAIIRSAAAFGFSAVLIPEHNQAPVTGAVVKTSAGMAFRIPLISIGNVNQTLTALKKKGFWTYGLDMNGTKTASEESFSTPSAFVIGNEGAGIREKTRAQCDVMLRIPMHKRTESLNAAVSAGIIFYEWSTKHSDAL